MHSVLEQPVFVTMNLNQAEWACSVVYLYFMLLFKLYMNHQLLQVEFDIIHCCLNHSRCCLTIYNDSVRGINFVVVLLNLWPHVLDTRVKRGAELSPKHHLVRWLRSWGRMPLRPGRPKCTVRVCWERLESFISANSQQEDPSM